MPFDGLFMRRVIEEIDRKIKGPLRNIYRTTRVDYYMHFQDGIVRISLNPSHSFIALVDDMEESPKMPPSFVMLLRKKLRNARFEGVHQDGYSRVAMFDFKRLDEKGDTVHYRVVVEVMGKHSNLILLDDSGRIVDVHRRIVTRSGRELLPGKRFRRFEGGKLDPMSSDLEEVFSDYVSGRDDPVEFLVRRLEGISRVLAREIVFRARSCGVSGDEVELLKKALEDFRDEYSRGETYVLYDGEKPVDVSPVVLRHAAYRHVSVEPSRAIGELILWIESEERVRQLKRHLEKSVLKEIDRREEILEKIEEDLSETDGLENLRKFGELLLAYSHEIPKGVNRVRLRDWDTGEEIEVELDPRSGPVRTAQDYFKRYEKYKRKREILESRKKVLERELEYLHQLEQMIVDAEDVDTLEEIKSEMEENGFTVAKPRKVGRKKTRRSRPRKVVVDGFTILVGKNNSQNDELVRSASPDDVWLHAHEIPGAHVVIKTGGLNVPNDVLEFAASLAAGYSKGRDSGRVPVDYTKIRYVKKPKGFKPGMVVYRNYKTVFVKPRRLQ